jgi:hypothetical protein
VKMQVPLEFRTGLNRFSNLLSCKSTRVLIRLQMTQKTRRKVELLFLLVVSVFHKVMLLQCVRGLREEKGHDIKISRKLLALDLSCGMLAS